MKVGWSKARLESVCHEITDGSHFSPKTTLSGYPYITVRDIENDRVDFNNCKFISEIDFKQLLKNGCKPNLGDVLFSKDGTVGKVSLVDYEKEFVVLSSLAIIRPKQEIVNSAFLKYMLQSPIFLDEAIGKKTGVAIRRIILRNLKSIFVPTPPIDEQQRIVAILDQAFEGIAIARANAEQNLQNARALFESHLQSVFTQRGQGWTEKRFDQVCVLQRGFDLPTQSRTQGKYPLVTSNGITDTHNEAKVKGPGVVTGRSGSIGNVFFVEEDFWPLNTALYIKDFHGNDPKFIHIFLQYFDLKRFATGTGVPTLNRNFVHSEIVITPDSVYEQKTIVEKVQSLLENTQRLDALYQRKIACLDELKKSLLQQAFAGEL